MTTDTIQSDLRRSPFKDYNSEEDFDIDIRHILLMIWRRKVMISTIMVVGLFLAIVLINMIPPRYTAKSMILLEASSSSQNANEVMSMISNLQIDNALMLGELEVLRSRNAAKKVVEHLNLLADPELNDTLNLQTAENKTASNEETSGFKNLNLYQSELQSLPHDIIDQQMDRVVTKFLSKLRINSIPGSFVIQIEYSSTDPVKAARIANAVADLYIEARLEAKFKATQKITNWLDKRLTSLREQVRNSELAVENYRAANNLAQGTRTVMSAEQLSATNGELAHAKAQLAENEARLRQIMKISDQPNRIETAIEVMKSNLIQNMKRDEVTLQRRLSELSTRYGHKHPSIIDVKSQLKKLHESMRAEMSKIAKSVASELRVSEARVQSLEKTLDRVQGQRNEDNAAMVRLRELERDAASNRLIFDTFLETYKKTNDQNDLQEPEARIISFAIPPNLASYPNKILILSLSAVIALFIGLTLSFFLEKLNNTFHSASQLERIIGFSCYGLIPMLGNMTRTEIGRYILIKPSSTVAEAVRTLRMVLNLRTPSGASKPKVVTVTSSFPNEGKTTLSIWMGRLAAKSGEKVIVLDCDLRRPSINGFTGKDNDASIVDYLTNKKNIKDVICKDDESGVHIIYASAVPNSALDLISSKKMQKLVQSLSQAYDLVILDSPACLAVSDARVLAKLSDQTLYAVAWDKTPREVVIGGVKQFTDINYNALSFVLTNVDIKKHARYGYFNTVYYGRETDYHIE